MSRAPRKARIAGAAVLTLGLAAAIAAVPGAAFAATGQPAASSFTLPTHSAAVSWGRNDDGQEGNGAGFGGALYGGVSGLGSGVTQVSAGWTHALAVKSDGTVWAWGDNEAGQIGDGTLADRPVPVEVAGLTGVTQVAAGLQSSVALRSDGTVWQWGYHGTGPACQVTQNVGSMEPVEVATLNGVKQVAAGADFELAVKSDGTVWGTGCDEEGQLGLGYEGTVNGWVQIPGLHNVLSVSAGYDSAVALERRSSITTQTQVMAWGRNVLYPFSSTKPVQIFGINAPEVSAVAAGSGYMLALGDDGSVWSWGKNFQDDMGVTYQPDAPVEIQAPGSGVTQVSAGDTHALALRSNGTVLAWGSNDDGQLGIGTTGVGSTAVQVSGLNSATQVSAGLQFSLAIHQVLNFRPPR
jgi:alpha-tubulin suppressor-like RCC1 family protein